MDDKNFWLALAAVCGGAVYQVKKNEPLSVWRRLAHLAATLIVLQTALGVRDVCHRFVLRLKYRRTIHAKKHQ